MKFDNINNLNSKTTLHHSNTPSPSSNPIIAISDTGATAHYFRPEDAKCLQHITPQDGPIITLPDNSTIKSTHKGLIPLHRNLSKTAKTTHIVPQLKSTSLLSTGQLCDDDCEVLYRKKDMFIAKNKQILHRGTRNNQNGLWNLPLYKCNDPYPITSIEPVSIKTPSTHAAMYGSSTNNTTITSHHPCSPITSITTPKYSHIFQDMNELIDQHQDEHNIKTVQQEDRIEMVKKHPRLARE